MLDERDDLVTPADRSQAFNQQPVGKRIAIIAAGPIANLMLCLVFYWVMFVVGKPDFVPVIGNVSGIALQAGIKEGDILVRADGIDTPTQTQAVPPLMLAAIDRRDIEIVVESPSGVRKNTVLKLSQLPADFDQAKLFPAMGFNGASVPPVVGEIKEGSAAVGHLRIGDRILKVGNIPIHDYRDISPAVMKQAQPGTALPIEVERNGFTVSLSIEPKAAEIEPGLWDKARSSLGLKVEQKKPVWQLGMGVSLPPAKKTLLIYGPYDAIGASFRHTWETTTNTLAIIKRLITGAASAKNVSGTITVARVANQEASTSVGSFFGFLAFFSLSLCIMNLLPIPVLDGGHLLYYAIELVTGHPVAEKIQMAGQFIGLALLAGLMVLAHYNDIVGLFPH